MTYTFDGPDQVAAYQVVVLKQGLKLYANTGMKPNRAWTPAKMLKAASRVTGKPYKRGQYLQAAADLDAMLPDRPQQPSTSKIEAAKEPLPNA